MSDATCKTCPYCWRPETFPPGECRRYPPLMDGHSYRVWAAVDMDDWCGEHPDRQPHLECATATLVERDTVPTEGDMRRIIDALEKIASRAQRATP